MEILLGFVLVLAVIGAIVLRLLGRAEQKTAGLPIDARVIYSDTGAWERVEKPLFSKKYRLTGKPDYIVVNADGATIPIEVKPNRADTEPRESDTMQLMAYGVLIEETYGTRAEYGLLKYRDGVFRVEFTDDLRGEFLAVLEEMRAACQAVNVPRSHEDAMRCRYCGYREECDERLV